MHKLLASPLSLLIRSFLIRITRSESGLIGIFRQAEKTKGKEEENNTELLLLIFCMLRMYRM